MHAYKHNVSGGATDFTYQSHEIVENEKGKELVIHTATGYGVKAEYHMQFFNGVAAVQVWTVLKNEEPKPSVWNMSLPLSIRDSARAAKNRILKKTSVYTPHNSWDCESQWRKMTAGRSI